MKYSIFISYRSSDISQDLVNVLVESLENEFGQETVFLETSDLHNSAGWLETLQLSIPNTKICLVLIGSDWLEKDHKGQSRILNPEDRVRKQIEEAIEYNLIVIPTIINSGVLPNKSDLPQSLHPLLETQAISLNLSHWSIYKSRFLRDIAALLPESKNNIFDSTLNKFKSIFSPTPILTPAPSISKLIIPTITPNVIIPSITKSIKNEPIISLFISYSHAYKAEVDIFVDKLRVTLRNIEKYKIKIWIDADIFIGEDWDHRIRNEITRSHICLLLLTDTFFSSDYIKNNELTSLLNETYNRHYPIIPVYFSPCDYKDWNIFKQLQIFIPSKTDFPSIISDDFGFTELIFEKTKLSRDAKNSPDVNRYFKIFRKKLEPIFESILSKNE